MKFESKFNLGDEIYAVSYDILNYEISKTKIIGFGVYMENNQITLGIFGEYGQDYSEEDCFATLAEAQAECDRRNKEDK